jgi:hypothetical protein
MTAITVVSPVIGGLEVPSDWAIWLGVSGGIVAGRQLFLVLSEVVDVRSECFRRRAI